MKSLSSLLLAGLVAAAVAAPVTAQRSDDQIQPKSVELMHRGQALMSRASSKTQRMRSRLRSQSIRAIAGLMSIWRELRSGSIYSARRCG